MKYLFILTLLIFSGIVTSESEVPETVWSVNDAQVACSPKVIPVDGVLNIKLGGLHGKELAVRRHKDNLWLYLVLTDGPPEMKSLMSSNNLKGAKSIKLDSSTSGWSYPNGNQLVFTQPGKYTVYFSDVLESDLGGYICSVTVKSH